MPRMTGMTEEIAKALYLRKYPTKGWSMFSAAMKINWYRIEMQCGGTGDAKRERKTTAAAARRNDSTAIAMPKTGSKTFSS